MLNEATTYGLDSHPVQAINVKTQPQPRDSPGDEVLGSVLPPVIHAVTKPGLGAATLCPWWRPPRSVRPQELTAETTPNLVIPPVTQVVITHGWVLPPVINVIANHRLHNTTGDRGQL